jgi:hypothetical protein
VEGKLRLNRTAHLCFIASTFMVLGACSSSRAPSVEPAGASATTVFGDELSLTGYTIRDKDGHTELELRWKALRKLSTDYRTFVHALDATGTIVFQGDHTLKNATGASTSAWAVGDSVEDRFSMTPPGKPPGKYTLRIGVYVLGPFRVLPLTQSALPQPPGEWADHSVVIANVDCK